MAEQTESTASRLVAALDALEVPGDQNTAVFSKVRDLGKASAAALSEAEDTMGTQAKQIRELQESAVTGIVDSLGRKGMDVSIITERLKGAPDVESVSTILTDLGIPFEAPKAPQTDNSSEGSDEADKAKEAAEAKAKELGKVADLGQAVEDAATGNVEDTVIDKIAAAETQEDLEAVMAEAGELA